MVILIPWGDTVEISLLDFFLYIFFFFTLHYKEDWCGFASICAFKIFYFRETQIASVPGFDLSLKFCICKVTLFVWLATQEIRRSVWIHCVSLSRVTISKVAVHFKQTRIKIMRVSLFFNCLNQKKNYSADFFFPVNIPDANLYLMLAFITCSGI